MKSTSRALCVALCALALAACGPEPGDPKPEAPATSVAIEAEAPAATVTSAAATCTVEPATFSGWFESGSVTAGGAVNPASSMSFTTDNPNGGSGPNVCTFYQWGAQMFLWLTSPEDGGLVLDGPAIFTVSPASDNKRSLIPNTTGANFRMALRTTKADDVGEFGQAGGNGVLLSQQNALVYCGIAVNDVYAYFLSGQKSGPPLSAETDFPRNATDLQAVVDYARSAYSATIVAPETLAIELETSWVDASTVGDPARFVTVNAEVPVFSANADNTEWTQSGTAIKQLALVGFHVVGTVQDHPEFVWATFEHVNNAPDDDYYYTNDQNQVVKHSYSSAEGFTFMAKGDSQVGANTECAKADGARIVAVTKDGAPVCDGGIVGSNTMGSNPWGSAGGDNSAATVRNNTLLLSINSSVRSQLAAGDVRGNYIQVGGIWTTTSPAGGDAPIPNQQGDQTSQLRGSLKLANATMETYNQNTHCFTCHSLAEGATNSFGAFRLSHIYSEIEVLPTQ